MIARLLSSEEIAPEVRRFCFEIPELERFTFVPGQFLSFREEIDGKQVTRAYSIASEPDGNRFELCLNRVKEGRLSPHLFSLKPGQTIRCEGPYGVFVAREPLENILLVATGTGVAPFRSMLRAGLPARAKGQCTLLLGARHEESILYRAEFEAMAKRYSNFRFLPTLTQPPEGWTGLRGRVQAHLDGLLAESSPIHVYLCGMKAMVDDLRQRLKNAGVDRNRIVFEKYD